MTTITNRAEFERMLTDEQAELFTFFAWSGQAVASLMCLRNGVLSGWRRIRLLLLPFYRLAPDVAHPETWSWLIEQARSENDNESGFGAVAWLHRGKSVAFRRYAAEAGKPELSRLTDEALGTTHADKAEPFGGSPPGPVSRSTIQT